MVAKVQRGTAGLGACMSSWHSIQEDNVGSMTLAWPLKPARRVSSCLYQSS